MNVHEHVDITVIINDLPVVIHESHPTVAAITEAAHVDPQTNVLVELRGEERIEFDDPDQRIAVHHDERFETKPRIYTIFVNGRPREVDKRILTFDDVVALDPNPPPPGDDVEYTITFFDAVEPHKGFLTPGKSVVIKEGTRFNVRSTNRS